MVLNSTNSGSLDRKEPLKGLTAPLYGIGAI